MLHTNFQRHQPFGSGEDFLKVFTIYGHDGHLGHVTRTIWTNFRSPIPRRLHMKFGFNRPSGFWGEDVWKCWHTHTTHTYIRTTEACLSYRLTHTQLTMYICRPFQYDCTSRPYELVLVALQSVVVSLQCVLVTMERFWFCSGLSTRTVIWWMKQRKNGRVHRHFVLSFRRTEICYVRLLSRIVMTYIFAESRINRVLFRNRTVKPVHPFQT